MRSLLLLLAFVGFAFAASAQGTLQFNQALLLSNGTGYTVPANKVWKMTGLTSTTAGSGNSTAQLAATINGTTHYFSNRNYSGGGSALLANQTLWFPAGTTITPTSETRAISVIEFNIVP